MRLRRAATLAFTWALLAAPAWAANWQGAPSISPARYGAAGVADGDAIYVLGGSAGGSIADVSIWNPATGTWSGVAPMPMARQFLGAASLGGMLYAVGGLDASGIASAQVDRFDPSTGTWTTVAPMPSPRAAMGAAVAGGALFVAGGEIGGALQSSAFRYDPATGWSTIADLPTPRTGTAAASLGGRVWVIGGSNGVPVATVEVYDPSTGVWTPSTSLPEPLWMPAATTFDNRVWVIGGFDARFARSDRVYSAGADGVWRVEALLPEALAASAVAANATQMRLASGVNASGQASGSSYVLMSSAPPPPPPPAVPDTLGMVVSVDPAVLQATSNGRWMSATLRAVGWNLADLDPSSLTLGGVAVDPEGPVSLQGTGVSATLTVKFPREPFAALPSGTHALALVGTTNDGHPAGGTATLTVRGDATAKGLQRPRPGGHALQPVAPGATAIRFTLDRPAEVTLEVLDLQGRRVALLEHGAFGAGTYTSSWSGSALAAGVYFARLRADSFQDVMRFSVLR